MKEGIFSNTRVRKVSVYAMLRNDKAKGGIIKIKPTKRKKKKRKGKECICLPRRHSKVNKTVGNKKERK